MTGKSTYGLTPKQLDQLLALGSGDPEREPVISADDPPLGKEYPPAKASSHAKVPLPQIPGYEILDKLGQAGQGQVWRALQLSTHRQVALKLPLAGSIHAEKGLLRFEREVELAAGLTHPNIARIHGSGLHEGLYFYAMDLIQGKHLDDYVRSHQLSTRSILELMKTVCAAVQHAHQNGMIHRDLKPSNILVKDDGQPVIVDFGLARNLALQEGAESVSLSGEVTGTPAYMSPEQAAGRTDQLDTRTDVYSLGVLLFVLLTGQTPHEMSGTHYEVMQRIAEEPVRPPRKLCARIDPELQWLLLKALDQDQDRRYISAGALAEDIGRYLNDLPLLAAPPSKVYVIKRFVRRHRTWVMAAAALILVLTGGFVASTYFALGQARALDESRRITDYLYKGVLQPISQERGRYITAQDIIDTATENLAGRFRDYPRTEARIRGLLGSTYLWGIGDSHAALAQMEESQRISQERLGEHPKGSSALGVAYLNLGRYEEAAQQLEQVVERSRRLSKVERWQYLGWGNLARVYIAQGRYKEAEELWLESWQRHFNGEEDTLPGNLAEIYRLQGRYEEAERIYRKWIERNQTDDYSWDFWFFRCGLGQLYTAQGRYDEANDLLVSVWDRAREKAHEKHAFQDLRTLHCLNCLAVLRREQEQYDEAETLFQKVLDGRNQKLGEDHPTTLETINDLGVLRREQHRYEEAESLLCQALQLRKHKLGDHHPGTLETKNDLAVLYIERGDYDTGEQLLTEAFDGRRLRLGDTHPHTIESMNNLIRLYKACNKPDKAEQWRAKLPQVEASEQ